ncbi:MAG: trimeric intracellular cation channel family protein [Gammaproteobacteria bacterium]|nr:trimeric intracellular cation channel family protein [Gammaproteobacteria bacterium]
MAATGVIQAYRHNFDPLGAGVLALITAVGGGTLRDLLLGATPVFWITDLIYIGTVVPVSVFCVLFARRLRAGHGRRAYLLNYIDAIGLALFTILGVQKSIDLGVHAVIAILMGAVTGIAGGMIRDILCGEPPVVLRADLYTTLSLLGGGLLVVLLQYLSFDVSSLITFLFIVSSRFWVIYRGINLPSLKIP